MESGEISTGVVLDYNADGNLVGVDVDNASGKVRLEELAVSELPALVQNVVPRVSENANLCLLRPDRRHTDRMVWDPRDEYGCEETGDEMILMKDETGQVTGFEKLNFSVTDSKSVRSSFERS